MKWVKRILVIAAASVLSLIGAAFVSENDRAILSGRVSNEAARTIRPDWTGTPVDQRGRFMNDEFPFLPKTSELLKWQLSDNPFEAEKEADTFRPEVLDPTPFLNSNEDGILWLGHASFYIRLGGRHILIDPVFGDPSFITRYTDVPSPLDSIRAVDYVLLTHDHRDHTDEPTLRSIAEKFPKARFLAGLGSEDILADWTGSADRTALTGWFQDFTIDDPAVDIYFLPVRHWSRRGLFDTNRRLWGGYVIESGKTTIYHGGDSGYGRHYRETGELFPEIDYFLIGIGSYEPRWFMEPNHNNPSDVVKAFQDIGAKMLVPMHYGTFNMSDEAPGTPIRTLRDEVEKAGLTDRVGTLNIYESLAIP